MDKNNRNSLSEEIAGILQTVPGNFDPEDNFGDETTAKIIVSNNDALINEEEERILSNFRKHNIDLLSEVDSRYAGKKGSRRNLKEFDDSSADGSAESLEEDRVDEDDDDDDNGIDEEEENDDDDDSSSSSVGSDDGNDNNEFSDEASDFEEGSEEKSIDDITEDNSNFKHITETNISTQMKKGLCVRNQMNIWENLLEIRIQLQKCLINANKMPQKEYLNGIKKQSSQEFCNKIAETKKNVTTVLDQLLKLQNLFLKQYPETKNINKNEEVLSDNEEIPSDTSKEEEEVKSEQEEENKEEIPMQKKKKRKLMDYESEIKEKYDKYKKYRNTVINKWNDKTRINIIKSNTASYSVLNQIEHNLSDKSKLIKRTQLKRSQYNILGENTVSIENDNNETESLKKYNTEIFDDDDFYHQLLRELIEVKSADLTDPIQLGRQWIQLQNLRSKMKRKIDTKATKGRKIRYAVHTKLVNFMAPIDQNLWTDAAKTELYNSLFGKKQNI